MYMFLICNVFFFNDTATTEIYTLSLHDALPIYADATYVNRSVGFTPKSSAANVRVIAYAAGIPRSEEHTSELQSRSDLVCRLLLEKKKKIIFNTQHLSHICTILLMRS